MSAAPLSAHDDAAQPALLPCPQNGYFLGEVAYTSNLPGWSVLHMDLNDESLSIRVRWRLHAQRHHPRCAGVVLLNVSYTQALNLSDVIGIHLYMASGC